MPVAGRAGRSSRGGAAYEMLSGSPPFRRDDAMALMYAQMHAAPPLLTGRRPDLPAAADEVFARALAKAPAERYGNCMQFADAVRQALGQTAAGAGAATVDAAIPPQIGELPAKASRQAPGGRLPPEVVPVLA